MKRQKKELHCDICIKGKNMILRGLVVQHHQPTISNATGKESRAHSSRSSSGVLYFSKSNFRANASSSAVPHQSRLSRKRRLIDPDRNPRLSQRISHPIRPVSPARKYIKRLLLDSKPYFNRVRLPLTRPVVVR